MSAETISEAGEAITDIASAIEAAAKIVETSDFSCTHGGFLHHHDARKTVIADRIRTLTARVAVAPEAELLNECKSWFQRFIDRHTLKAKHAAEELLAVKHAYHATEAASAQVMLDKFAVAPEAADPAVEGTARELLHDRVAAILATTRAGGGDQAVVYTGLLEEITAALARSVGPDLRGVDAMKIERILADALDRAFAEGVQGKLASDYDERSLARDILRALGEAR